MFTPTDLMYKLAESQISDLNLKDKEITEIESLLEEYLDDDTYKAINITYYGEPKAQARARASSNLNHFYDPSKSFKLVINEAIRNELGNDFKPINSEIYFEARYYKPFPKSTSKKNQVLMELGVVRPTNKPDLDNYEKLLYDALLNVLYLDDSIVVSGNHQKFFSCKPRVEITIKFRKNKNGK
ncbi:MAG: hypothetical protein [Bacteriophage sp.]|nr:MAG: hypothetical protein [Bacteriophage sp.]